MDADNYQADDVDRLARFGIAVLPVAEIENIILLPTVSRAIAESEGYRDDDLENQLNALKAAVFETLNSAEAIDVVVTRYCRRRIDRLLKKIDLSSALNVPDITAEYGRQTAALDIGEIARQARARIEEALRDEDLPKLLANYDNKGLMALAARHLKQSRLADFESWFTRVLRNNSVPALVTAINRSLPGIAPE